MSAERPRSYLRIEGTTWPNPADPNDVEWRLRYGNPTREDLLTAASFMHAYCYLIAMPQLERNHRVATIRLAASSFGGQQPKDGDNG